jgi:hypothetical protein
MRCCTPGFDGTGGFFGGRGEIICVTLRRSIERAIWATETPCVSAMIRIAATHGQARSRSTGGRNGCTVNLLPLALQARTPGAMQVNSVQTYHAAGLAGIGLIQAGYLALAQYIERGALVEILLNDRIAGNHLDDGAIGDVLRRDPDGLA